MAYIWIWVVEHWQEFIILGVILGAAVELLKILNSLNSKLDSLAIINEERAEDFTILFEGMWACLDGLTQQGANGPVSKAKDALKVHLFKRTGQG